MRSLIKLLIVLAAIATHGNSYAQNLCVTNVHFGITPPTGACAAGLGLCSDQANAPNAILTMMGDSLVSLTSTMQGFLSSKKLNITFVNNQTCIVFNNACPIEASGCTGTSPSFPPGIPAGRSYNCITTVIDTNTIVQVDLTSQPCNPQSGKYKHDKK